MNQISLYEVVKPQFTDEELVNFEIMAAAAAVSGVTADEDSRRPNSVISPILKDLGDYAFYGVSSSDAHNWLADKPAGFMRKTKGTIYEGLFSEFRRRQQGKYPRYAFRICESPTSHVRFID